MKKILLASALLLIACITTMGSTIVAQGQTNTKFGDYSIVALDDHLVVDGKELDKYLISYERPDLKVIVAVDKQANCKKYYVLGSEFAVQYECNGTYFGIKKLDNKSLAKSFATSLENLDREEFYHQRILTTETRKTMDHLNLIAAYFPELFPEVVS